MGDMGGFGGHGINVEDIFKVFTSSSGRGPGGI